MPPFGDDVLILLSLLVRDGNTCIYSLLRSNKIVSFLSSDTLYSSVEPLEPPKFDASLLADIPFRILLDLLTLSGLCNVEKDQNFEKSLKGSDKMLGGDSNEVMTSADCSTMVFASGQVGDVTTRNGETFCQSKNKANESEKVLEGASEADAKAAHINSQSESSRPFHDTSDDKRKEISQDGVSSVKSNKLGTAGSVEPVVKVCALKSLTVLLGSNTLLETLMCDLYIENSSSSEELSQQRLNCMQTLLRSMVSYTVLPSPFRRVVTLMDLERSQSVLIRAVPSVIASKKVEVQRKASSEGKFV